MTFATACKSYRINKGLSHTYDRLSGWCIYGCGNRDDGRIVTREGNQIEAGPKYTAHELADMKTTADQIIAGRKPR